MIEAIIQQKHIKKGAIGCLPTENWSNDHDKL